MPAETPAAQSPEAQTPPPEPAACAGEKPAPDILPAGLAGRVTTSEWAGEKHALFISDLAGSNRVSLGYGAFPDLSPDGQRVVSLGPDDGLHVRDLSGGGDILLTGTIHANIFDTWPKWSPDGNQIAFDRVTGHSADIYLANSDGSNLRPVVSGPEDERLLGWSPDGRQVSYLVTAPEARVIQVLDLQTSHTYEAGRIPAEAINASVTRDGKRLLYTNAQGLYVLTIGEAQPVLALAGTPAFGNQIHPIWSPDGQWIAISYWDPPSENTPKLALFQPDTCQVVIVPGQKGGWLSSWVP